MLAEPQEEGLFSSEQIREYIGQSFRERVRYIVPEWYTNQDICDYLIRKSILVHLENYEDKFNLVCFMIKKLFQLVSFENKYIFKKLADLRVSRKNHVVFWFEKFREIKKKMQNNFKISGSR